ncbi:hypothetical protein MERGE_003085 [Pneumocystis wakefieldiae]|uniref:Ribonuclease P protein subunit n=1 Tax=Pneumocystis wakefieldiae TaxID=38082 RepID=A0A899G3P1_9ASCO|nr:hypothetical protein MERGE_003085 [Pneumocystis wakefieldiae]
MDPLYQAISSQISTSSVTSSQKHEYGEDLVLNLLKKGLPDEIAESLYINKVKNKPLLIHPTDIYRNNEQGNDPRNIKRLNYLSKLHHKGHKKKPKALSSREKKATGIYNITKDACKYNIWMPLHSLWKEYIKEIVGSSSASIIPQKLLKADMHGSKLKVVRSRCPSRVGIEGICIKETKKTFILITEKNQQKVIPKENSIFSMEIEQTLNHTNTKQNSYEEINGKRLMVFEIMGSHFIYRAAERIGKKIKSKSILEL